MRKTKEYGIWHRYKNISLILLVAAFIISAAITVVSLRANNIKMINLRQAVYTADQQNGDINKSLNDLRQFVYRHMNTNLKSGSSSSEPPIQLVNQFNRDIDAERQRIAALGSADTVYINAQTTCEKAGVPITQRAQCIQDYVTKNGKGIPQLNLPVKEVYTFDFTSPLWSPDLAGFSLIVTIVFGVMISVRLISGIIFKNYFKI